MKLILSPFLTRFNRNIKCQMPQHMALTPSHAVIEFVFTRINLLQQFIISPETSVRILNQKRFFFLFGDL